MTLMMQTFVRAVLLGLMAIVVFAGIIFVLVRFQDTNVGRVANCTFLDAAPINILGQTFMVPARKRVTIEGWSQDHSTDYRIETVSEQPWEEPLGFCGDDLENLPPMQAFTFRGSASRELIDAIGLPLHGDLDLLRLGLTGIGAGTSAAPDIEGPADRLIQSRRSEPDAVARPFYNLTHLSSASPLSDGLKYSTSCHTRENNGPPHCSLRLTRQSDGFVVEIWSIEVDRIPQEGEAVPDIFKNVGARFDDVLLHFHRYE